MFESLKCFAARRWAGTRYWKRCSFDWSARIEIYVGVRAVLLAIGIGPSLLVSGVFLSADYSVGEASVAPQRAPTVYSPTSAAALSDGRVPHDCYSQVLSSDNRPSACSSDNRPGRTLSGLDDINPSGCKVTPTKARRQKRDEELTPCAEVAPKRAKLTSDQGHIWSRLAHAGKTEKNSRK